jgi:hypothetical protein
MTSNIKRHFILVLFTFNFITIKSFAQTTIFSYSGLPNQAPISCFFNNFPGPTNPVTIGGYSHYGIVGGVDYSGNEFVLNANNNGGGSGFGIYFGFNQNYKYTISANLRASSGTMKWLWATNQYRQGIPASCAPGFPNSIISSADATSSITSIPQSYSNYTLISNYTPSAPNINYLLMTAYNTVGSIGNTQVQSITINSTPLCKAPTITNAVAIGGNQIQVFFAPPAFNTPINNYKIRAARYSLLGFPPVPVISNIYNFNNVGVTSPVTITVPLSGNYFINVISVCGIENSPSSSSYTVNNVY